MSTGIQVPIGIDPVNAVPSSFEYGPYPDIATALIARDPLLRYDGMTVQITGSGNYWWTIDDLSDTGLKPKVTITSPITRYVYLVQDSDDALRMGGTLAHSYNTFQSAYDAANVISGSKGIVVLQVGNITAAIAGDLTLAGNWNPNIILNGINPFISVVGNIIGNSGAASRSVGTTTNATTSAKMTNVKVGNISTGLALSTGISNSVVIDGYNLQIGDISTANTNSTNTNTTGLVRINNFTNLAPIIVGNIITTTSNSTATSGAVSILCPATIVSITTVNSTGNAGAITLNPKIGKINLTTLTYNSAVTAFSSTITITGSIITTANITLGNYAATAPVVITDSQITTFSFLNNSTGTSYLTINSCIMGTMTNNSAVTLISYLTHFKQIVNLGNNSKVVNSTIDPTIITIPGINGIGNGCKLFNCTILNGSFSISNGSAVTVIGTSTVLENAAGSGVTVMP